MIVRDSGGLGRLRAADPAAGGGDRRARADAPAGRPRDRAAAGGRRPRRRRSAGAWTRSSCAAGSSPSASARRPRCSSSTLEDPAAAAPALEAALAAAACPAVVAPHAVGGRELLCAVVDAADHDPIEVAAAAREALARRARRGPRRAPAAPPRRRRLRHSFHEARCALEATAFANGSAPEVASWRDLGAFTLLLSIQDDDALALYCDSVLGPIEEGDEEYGGELLRSLEAFIEQNGQWERAAREVYCHRHTLRYRMRKVEELTGRDLSRAHDRIEFWLALRARELVSR